MGGIHRNNEKCEFEAAATESADVSMHTICQLLGRGARVHMGGRQSRWHLC